MNTSSTHSFDVGKPHMKAVSAPTTPNVASTPIDLGLKDEIRIDIKSGQVANVANVANVAKTGFMVPIDPAVEKEQSEKNALEAAKALVDKVLSSPEVDIAQLFSESGLQALRLITAQPSLWLVYREKIKTKCQGVLRISDVDRLVAPVPAATDDESAPKITVATELVTLVLQTGELFFDAEGDKSYLTLAINDAQQVLQIGSSSFCQWLSYSYFEATKLGNDFGRSVSDSAIKQACTTLSGIARNAGKRQRVHLRVAQYDQKHYLFIGDERQSVIEVTATGWQIKNDMSVKFWQPPAMKALPIPERGGNIDDLWQFINIPVAARPLVLAWLLESFRESSPKPILSLVGIQGSAKSSTQNKLRELIDNSAANLRAAPKCIEDLYVGAASNWVVSFENISTLSRAFQDALCTFATGAGASGRKLYSNAEEHIISYKRPVMINGIPMVITAQDLTDRVICLELPAIDHYLEEAELNARWEQAKPKIFGALVDLFVKTLAQLPKVKLHKPPRMADFTSLGEAMMQAQGYAAGTFQLLYETNRQTSTDNALEASSVAQAVQDLVYDQKGDKPQFFYGTYKTLLNRLGAYRKDNDDWPRSAKALADELRRQLPALKSIGIDVILTGIVERVGKDRGYTIKLQKNDRYDALHAKLDAEPSKVELDLGIMTVEQYREILDYLHAIDEHDPQIIEEVIEACKHDEQTLQGELKNARAKHAASKAIT